MATQIRTQVHPSPGSARVLPSWALPSTASCNMVTEENDHPAQEKDSNLLSSTELLIQNSMDDIFDIFDVIKQG